MNKKTIILSIIGGMFFVNGMFANGPKKEKEKFDINSITYIEDEIEFDLGFDTADYLPEDFDASKIYFNINSVDYIEEESILVMYTQQYLPKGFNAYAYPSDVQSINYIDENDSFEFRLSTKLSLQSRLKSNKEISK